MFRFTCAIPVFSLWAVMAMADPQPKPDQAAVDYFAYENKLASQGDANAEDCLGDMYRDGFGVPKDPTKQFYWHSAAAAAGNEIGKLDVAQDIAFGAGVQQDSEKALAMVKAVLAKGNPRANAYMGILYEAGIGVPRDQSQALEFYEKAAASGDDEAAAMVGLAYKTGNGVKADPVQAKNWLERAAQHSPNCAIDFLNHVSAIIYGYVDMGALGTKYEHGPLTIRYLYKDGQATDLELVQSSGSEQVDEAWLNAAREAKLPPWPDNYEMDHKEMGIWLRQTTDAKFSAAVKDAIDRAKIFPKDVLLKGSKGHGKVTVAFDYLDGKASNAKVIQSSDEPSEDMAALIAVTTAEYPPTPERYAHETIPMEITLVFGEVTPANASVVAVPAVVAH